jgi:DNA-binding MarR family transcriptional regulator
MSTPPSFSAQALGQTEKALNAILDRRLAGTGLTEPQWIALSLVVMSGGSSERAALVTRLTGGIKVSAADAEALVDALVAAQLVQSAGDSAVELTTAGQELHSSIRVDVVQITERLWGDLPQEDLAAAGRVLDAVLTRANAELAAAA